MGSMFKKCNSAILFSDDIAGNLNANFLKHANADVDGSILVIFKSGKKLLITSKMNERKAKELCKFSVKALPPTDMKKFLKKSVSGGKVGFDFESISAARLMRMKKLFGRRITDISEELEVARAVKSKSEIANLKKAVQISKQILSSLKLSSSITEFDVVKQLKLACISKGVELSFPPIVAAGSNAGKPHHSPTNKKLGKGMVLVDFGVKYKNYCADLTRCYFLGKCIKERKKYQEAKNMFHSLLASIPKCKTLGDIAKANEKLMKKSKWEIVHSIGHGIGLETHDPPSIYSKNKMKLANQMALAIEVGWYSKEFGVRYEENIIIQNKKAKLI